MLLLDSWKMNRTYTKEMEEFIFANCKGISTFQLTELFNKTFGTNFTRTAIKSKMNHLGATNELLRHKETHPCINHPNAIKTRFKKGQKSLNSVPIGTETVNCEGYHRVKVGENEWVFKHRLVYEQHFGKLKDDEEVIFLDGDRDNFDLSNLMKITHGENIRLNNLGMRTENAELTKACVGIVRLDKAIRNRQKHVK